MSDPTSSQNHAIAWLAMYVWWDGSSDTKARLTMTAHEEHGFPDPTFESIFCGSSFDPSLKADTTPTFLCNFLLGVFRDRRRWKHEESPASFGTVWPSSLPSARVCVTGPLQDACIAAATRDMTVCDRGIFQNSWPHSGTQKVEPASDGLCTRLVLEALVWVLGQLLPAPKPILIKCWCTTQTKLRKHFFFYPDESNKGTETCQNRFFFHIRIVWLIKIV